MIVAPAYYSWSIRSDSADELAGVRQWLPARVAPEIVISNTVRTYPAGVETRTVERHRLGDYFDSILLLSAVPQEPTAARLVFHRRPEAGRFWKDLMVNVLEDLRHQFPAVSVELDYKGDDPPLEDESD